MLDLEKLLKVMDPDPVLINQQACLRARHIRSACRACSDVCPVEAIGYADRKLTVDSALCSRCGLCLGACPTAALQVRGIDERGLEGATAVRCAKASGEGVTLPCLGALSVDHLIDLGSRCPGVTLLAGDCELCPLSRGGALARANLAAATETLRALGVSETPCWRTTHGEDQGERREISRRDLFSLWSQSAVQTGRSLLPDKNVNPVKLPANVPARRLRWLKRFAAPEGQTTMRWPTRQVAQGCMGCNICVAFCPTGALTSREADGTWHLKFQAAACVDCKTCIALCPRRLISPGEPVLVREVLAGDRRDLAAVSAAERPSTGGFRPQR